MEETNESSPPRRRPWEGRKPALAGVTGRPPGPAPGGTRGRRWPIVAALLLVLVTWAGSGAVAYAVVELTAGGDTGAQGPIGPQGAQGAQGERGLPGGDASQLMVKRLASLWATQSQSSIEGRFVAFSDERVVQCVQYILAGEGSITDCPGFTTTGQ